ncbi:MAG: A24 family peptidase [Anaerolineae bacterium]
MSTLPSHTVTLLAKLLITAWLVAVAAWDWRTGRIPNWLSLPMMAVAGGVQLYQGRWIIPVIWALLYLIWRVHIIGGGDAKLLMGLFALFPTQQFALVFGVVTLAVSVPLVVMRHWRGSLGEGLRSFVKTLGSGNPLPTREDLETHGRRYAWTFCLAGVIYLWWLW